jgi:anti-sigma regulatory factor (Ser/Thr protein kinase)
VSPLRNGSDAGGEQTIALAVTEASQVGEARRAAGALAARLGFDETEAGKVTLVVTEAANNLVKHGGGGELLLGVLEHGKVSGIEVLALDRGPGIADISRCLRDGFSTSGTPGTGLGAIGRLSTSFDVHSTLQLGTVLWARLWSGPLAPTRSTGGLDLGSVSLPHKDERVSGDAWGMEQTAGRFVILVADGLGHGPVAAEAAREAVRIFRENATSDPAETIHNIHAALRSTRGAAVAAIAIDIEGEEVRCAGVGNISGTIWAAGTSRSLVSHNGTVGHQIYKVQEFRYPFPRGALLVLHSDGLATSWRLDKYPGLATRHPSLVAAVLYRDFNRGRDDVTVLAAREEVRDSA